MNENATRPTEKEFYRVGEPGKWRMTWRYTEEAYNERWLKRLQASTVTNDKGCLVWQGWCNSKGYGQLSYRGKNSAIHRVVYALKIGPIPPGMLVCHTCDVRSCWNADHLFLGTEADNNRDCSQKGRHHNSVKTHCKRGHPYDEQNTYWKKLRDGSLARGCKACGLIKCRLELGWTLEQALTLPVTPHGHRPVANSRSESRE